MHGVALNRRIEQVEMAHAMTIAVSDVMDRAFGKGRGKILEKWTDEMLNELTPEERKKQVFTKQSMEILGRMPMQVIKKKE